MRKQKAMFDFKILLTKDSNHTFRIFTCDITARTKLLFICSVNGHIAAKFVDVDSRYSLRCVVRSLDIAVTDIQHSFCAKPCAWLQNARPNYQDSISASLN
jgi:hypothetical protein